MATQLPPDLRVSTLQSWGSIVGMLAFGAAILLLMLWIMMKNPPEQK